MSNIACEFITKSQKCALFLERALMGDKHNAKISSKLVKGTTENGIKDFHVHTVYCEVRMEILQNYLEYLSDMFPLTFAVTPNLTQETTFVVSAFTRVSSEETSATI